MPQDKLESLMLNRPVSITGEVKYPKQGDPGVVDDKFMRGLGVATGIDEQQPGDAAGAIGGALGAVSAINPTIARMSGRALLNRIKNIGISAHRGGNSILYGYKEAPKHIVDSLEMVQKRWPRTFGHLTDVEEIGPDLNNQITYGAFRPRDIMTDAAGPIKQGKVVGGLELNTAKIKNRAQADNTIGHELQHASDYITDKNSYERGRLALNLDKGYEGASHEIRARIQGAKTQAYGKGLGRKDIEAYAINTPDLAKNRVYLSEGYDIKRPIDSRISGLPPAEKPVGPGVSNNKANQATLLKIIQERADRRRRGLVDPRVPNPKQK